MHRKIFKLLKRVFASKRVKFIVFLLVSTYAIICTFLLVKKYENIPLKIDIFEDSQPDKGGVVSDSDKEILYCYDLIKNNRCENSSSVLKGESWLRCSEQQMLYDYLQSPESYEDNHVYLFDKDNPEYPIQANTEITSYKYYPRNDDKAPLNRVIINPLGKKVNQLQLPENIAQITILSPFPLSPKQTFKFIGEAFSFQNDDVIVLSVTENKRLDYVWSFLGLMEPYSGHIIECIDNYDRGREYFTDFRVNFIKNGDISTLTFRVNSQNGYGTSELYIPICYDKDTSKLYFFKYNNFSRDYYEVNLTDTKDSTFPISSKLENVTCLEKVISLTELGDKFPVTQQ